MSSAENFTQTAMGLGLSHSAGHHHAKQSKIPSHHSTAPKQEAKNPYQTWKPNILIKEPLQIT